MIAAIRGIIRYKSPEYIIVDVNGIGYQIFLSITSFYSLPDIDNEVTINTYTHVREDSLQLYGFSTLEEKEIFLHLIGISGIGPRLALNILSGISPSDLVNAINEGDSDRLLAIPGVGKKTAGRLILELKEKVGKGMPSVCEKGFVDDAISALTNLGYNRNQVKEVVRNIAANGGEGLTIERLIRESLKVLSGRNG